MKKLLVLLLEDDILGGVLSWPIRELGAKVRFYTKADHIRRAVEVNEPDVVLIDMPCGGPSMPSPETLAWIKAQCRSVRVVWDVSDTAWHEYLEVYRAQETFDCVIAADGATEWPHREGVDVSLPTPVDPQWYEGPPQERVHRLGFSGSVGNTGPRHTILGDLEADGTLTTRYRGPRNLPYSGNADFYRQCRAVINVAHTTSGRLQCKARCIEAALAGCLLFETHGSPLNKWLEPERDYWEYETPEEVRSICNRQDFNAQCKVFGERARAKVLELDLPRRFWGAVMGVPQLTSEELAGIAEMAKPPDGWLDGA